MSAVCPYGGRESENQGCSFGHPGCICADEMAAFGRAVEEATAEAAVRQGLEADDDIDFIAADVTAIGKTVWDRARQFFTKAVKK